jgi:hypothetical protein
MVRLQAGVGAGAAIASGDGSGNLICALPVVVVNNSRRVDKNSRKKSFSFRWVLCLLFIFVSSAYFG